MAIHLKKRSYGQLSSASMSDIAFLLLIFFLVTTIFSHDQGILMLLPIKAPPRTIQRGNLVTIRAHANGAITIDGEQVTINQVRFNVQQRLIENDKLVIVLETHQDADYGLMIDILDELRLAEAKRITLRKTDRFKNNS